MKIRLTLSTIFSFDLDIELEGAWILWEFWIQIINQMQIRQIKLGQDNGYFFKNNFKFQKVVGLKCFLICQLPEISHCVVVRAWFLDETLQDRRDSNFSHFVLFKGGENEVLATAKLQSDGARDSD